MRVRRLAVYQRAASVVAGAVAGKSAGGCYPNEPTWWRNPQFLFTVQHRGGDAAGPVSLVATLQQGGSGVGEEEEEDEMQAIGFMVSKAGAADVHPQLQLEQGAHVHSSKLVRTPIVSSTMDLPSGHYYITPFAYRPGDGFRFRLRLMSDDGLQLLHPAEPCATLLEVSGAWDAAAGLAGGCVNNRETWLKNPVFEIDVGPDPDGSDAGASVSMLIRGTDKASSPPAGLAVFR
eukprot:g1658.t1